MITMTPFDLTPEDEEKEDVLDNDHDNDITFDTL